jgi:hypothetical protein
MKVYLIFLFAGIVYAITLPANIDRAKVDIAHNLIVGGLQDDSSREPGIPVMPRQNIVIADSSVDEYCMWTQIQECLAYNPTIGGLEFVCDNFSIGSNFDAFQTDGSFSLFVTDFSVYNALLGPGAYPSAIAGTKPYLSFPYLILGQWGGMGAVYESGGWFSSNWDPPVDVGTGDVNVFRCIGKELPDGNIIFIGMASQGYSRWLVWSTYTPDLSTRLAGGIVAPETTYYWGFDINGGIAYLFYYDDSLNVYYKTTTDGVNWSPTQTYNLVWPNPFPNNVFYWGQVAVTDAGNPILVFDMINGDDAEYPYVGKVYVSTAPDQPCTEVGLTTSGAECFYPTIAAGGNYVVVLFGEARSGTGLYTFWDIYYNYSADNGVTWSTPRNLTGSITDHNNCLWQIAKRVDSSGNGQFFFAFGCSISDPLLDLYANIQSGSPTPSRWYVGRNPIVGIAEHKNEAPKKLALNIAPNPVRNQTSITYALPKSGNVSLKLYTADGRLVQTIDQGQRCAGFYTTKIDTRELANGAYVVVLKTDNRMVSGKLVIAH